MAEEVFGGKEGEADGIDGLQEHSDSAVCGSAPGARADGMNSREAARQRRSFTPITEGTVRMVDARGRGGRQGQNRGSGERINLG